MKKLSLLICSLVAAFAAMAQAPQQLNYQGVVRNSVGNAITNQAVSLRLTIHDGAPNGVVVYSETRSVTTNAFGLYNVVIGSPGATNVIGTIAGINWNTGGGKYLQVEVDPAGGSAFITAGTSQMNSVPYAILASGAPPIGPAGGDLTGTYPNPLLLLPNSRTVNAATTLLTLTNSGASAGSNAFEGITNSTAGNASGVVGTVSSTTPGGFSAGVRGINNGTGGLGIGVWGSQAGSGWGVYGTANGGIGVNGSAASGIGINGSSNTGTGGRFTTTSGLALHTTGGVRLQGIGEAANRVLVSDATGNATWQVLGAGAGIGGSGTLNFLAKWTPDGSNLGTSVIYDDGANAGIGTTAPTHRLTVQHTGSTGISVSSTSGFSVVDINAASGDAALRFGNAGVNQWNMRNRPGDNYLEWFELGGGGSRMVIQDGTGNVGIGETANPTYKLDVLHGGSTGIRSRSSGSFSVVDIDAASGDAALRFAKAGVNQWNIRNRPADDYLEIFELGGGGSRVVIQDATGNVGIGETTSPSYKLDVLHGGSTGIRSRSSSSFSVVDIDAASGDAALRFAKAGVNQWNIRNNPATDDLQIFELGGGGERMRIENTTGNVVVTGNLSKGGGSFKIDHPLDPANKYLYHSFVESPDMMNIYNGNIVTDGSGKATVTLPAYFEALNMEFRYQLTVIGSFSQAIISKEVAGNKFEIATNQPNVKVSWQVTGIRHDNYANQNRIPNEVDKEKENKGKYLHPKAFGKPVTDGIGYDVTLPGASTIDASIPVAAKPAPPTTGGSLEQGAIVPPVTTQMEKAGSVADMPKPVKVEPNPLNSKGSVEDAPAAKKVEANPLNSKGSVEDVPAAAKKAEKAPVKTTEKGSTEQ